MDQHLFLGRLVQILAWSCRMSLLILMAYNWSIKNNHYGFGVVPEEDTPESPRGQFFVGFRTSQRRLLLFGRAAAAKCKLDISLLSESKVNRLLYFLWPLGQENITWTLMENCSCCRRQSGRLSALVWPNQCLYLRHQLHCWCFSVLGTSRGKLGTVTGPRRAKNWLVWKEFNCGCRTLSLNFTIQRHHYLIKDAVPRLVSLRLISKSFTALRMAPTRERSVVRWRERDKGRESLLEHIRMLVDCRGAIT